MFKRLILGILIFLPLTVLQAQTEQSLIVLKEKVEQHLLNQLREQYDGQVKVATQKIDSRLHLKSCEDQHLDVFNPYDSPLIGSVTMGIRCIEADNPWKIYIPVRIGVEKSVVIARNTLVKEMVITENDVKLTNIDISNLKQGYYTDISQVIGQVAKQTIQEGNYIVPGSLGKATLIHKGERVIIQLINEGISITMSGIALSDGAYQDIIKVKNLSSNRIIDGQIYGRSEVRVTI